MSPLTTSFEAGSFQRTLPTPDDILTLGEILDAGANAVEMCSSAQIMQQLNNTKLFIVVTASRQEQPRGIGEGEDDQKITYGVGGER